MIRLPTLTTALEKRFSSGHSVAKEKLTQVSYETGTRSGEWKTFRSPGTTRGIYSDLSSLDFRMTQNAIDLSLFLLHITVLIRSSY